MSASPSPLNGAVYGHGAERSAASGTVLPMRPEPLGPPGPSGAVGRTASAGPAAPDIPALKGVRA